jgi:predicted transcriptional regulator
MNKSQQIQGLLQQLNLSKKEVAVFLSLTKLGRSLVSSIARDTKITRTLIYDITASLLEKGLITEMQREGKKHYEAIDHAGVMAYISLQKKELSRVEKQFAQAASAFHSLQKGLTQKAQVRFFDGLDGMANVYEEIRRDLRRAPAGERELITTWPTEKLEKVYEGFYEKNIYFDMPGLVKRDIMYESKMTQVYIQTYAESSTQHDYRIWPKQQGEFPTDVECWGNKVAFNDVQGHPSSVIIESQAVADTFRMFFNQMWSGLLK